MTAFETLQAVFQHHGIHLADDGVVTNDYTGEVVGKVSNVRVEDDRELKYDFKSAGPGVTVVSGIVIGGTIDS